MSHGIYWLGGFSAVARPLAAALITGFDPATKLIEQFSGYFQLEEVDVAGQRGRPTPLDMSLLLRLHLEADPRCIEVAVETGNELTLAILDGPACLGRAGQRYVVRAER